MLPMRKGDQIPLDEDIVNQSVEGRCPRPKSAGGSLLTKSISYTLLIDTAR